MNLITNNSLRSGRADCLAALGDRRKRTDVQLNTDKSVLVTVFVISIKGRRDTVSQTE